MSTTRTSPSNLRQSPILSNCSPCQNRNDKVVNIPVKTKIPVKKCGEKMIQVKKGVPVNACKNKFGSVKTFDEILIPMKVKSCDRFSKNDTENLYSEEDLDYDEDLNN